MEFVSKNYWNITPKEAIKLQETISRSISTENKVDPDNLSIIAAVDVSYYRNLACGKAAIVLWDYKKREMVNSVTFSQEITFPYVPGLLSFRECPLIIEGLKKLRFEPDLIITDGQGIAHPRKMGEATHLGWITRIPTIGCAKSKLFGNFEQPALKKGSYSFLYDNDGAKIGVVLRSKDNTKPIFVSPGHMIDVETSLKIILNLLDKYRIPQPLRIAHILSKI